MTTALYSMMTEYPFGFILESEVEAEEGGWMIWWPTGSFVNSEVK